MTLFMSPPMLLPRPGPWWVEAAAGRSEPVFSFEGEIQQRGQGGDEGGGGRESPVDGVAGVGQVLPVEAGDRGGDRDDRRPAGHLLHDEVHPVGLDGQVGLDGRGDQVAQGFGPLGGAQHVVVDVLVVGGYRGVDGVQVAADQGVEDLPHGQHDPAHHYEVLAQLERAPLNRLDLGAAFVEEQVFELLDAVVKPLYGDEVAVDEVVEQAVEQECDTMLGEVG